MYVPFTLFFLKKIENNKNRESDDKLFKVELNIFYPSFIRQLEEKCQSLETLRTETENLWSWGRKHVLYFQNVAVENYSK